MSQTSPNLALPYLQPAQAQKHVTHNEALRILDAVTQLTVLSASLSDPPANPNTGDRYILPPGPGGDWAGHGLKIALFSDNHWQFFTPAPGWRADVTPTGQTLRFDGNGWTEATATASQSVPELGVNTTADATNRLAVSAQASLLTHAGAGHQLKLNKSQSTDTATLLFQTGFSGRAEMGTAGSDNFAIKVSPDGTTFLSAIRVDATTGQVRIGADTDLLQIGTSAPDIVGFGGRMRLASYTVSTLPPATEAGTMIFVTDAANGAVPAFSDGSDWRRCTDRSVIS